jgi:integrase
VQHRGSLPYQEIGALMAQLQTSPRDEESYSVVEAAEATGMNRYTIIERINEGRLHAHKKPGTESQYNSPWFIEPAELFKLYPRKNAPAARPRIPLAAFILQFTILTAVRASQARYIRWNEIDLPNKLWTCPWQRTKTGRKTKKPHLIPLSKPATTILETMDEERKVSGIPSEFVFAHGRAFAGVGSWEGKPLNAHSVNRYLQRISDRTDITVHGFRTTFSSWANDHNFPRETIEMALDHVIGNEVERIYARDATRLEQRRQLMEAWAEHCSRTEPLPGDVIPFRQAN